MNKLKMIASQGDLICIFPEGGRSRTGFVDPQAATYGIGQILNQLQNPVVWCVYLRGHHQEGYSWFPKKGEHFHISIRSLEAKSIYNGRRAAKDKTLKIFDCLQSMEEQYLDYRKRSSRFGRGRTTSKVLQPHH